jgi:excisionase family DNA binding protein
VEKTYTVKEAAKLLHYSARHIRQKCANGDIAAKKLAGGRKWLIGESEIQRVQNGGRETVKLSKAMRQHFNELSTTALKLADHLGKYLEHSANVINWITKDFPYELIQYDMSMPTGHLQSSERLDVKKVSNLASHLKDEIPELATLISTAEQYKEWIDFPDDKKQNTLPPDVVGKITKDLVLGLRLMASKDKWPGKCPDCPT